MQILGIDPGYDRVGWAILDISDTRIVTLVECGCIQTNKNSFITERYKKIISDLTAMYSRHHIDEVAMETLFFSKNQKTAIRVSEARGVIIATFIPHSISLFEYSPNQVKLTVTGYGSADKLAVEKMIRLQLKIPNTNLIDDTIDAIAIGFTHSLLRK